MIPFPQQSFKIPKKQRIRERKEHERELGSLAKSPKDAGNEEESAGPHPYPAAHSPSLSHASHASFSQSLAAYYDTAKYEQNYYYDYYARGDYQYEASSDYYYQQQACKS